jgi:hypothetical protein
MSAAEAANTEIALGQTAQGRFELKIELHDKDGHQLAEARSPLVVAAPVTALVEPERAPAAPSAAEPPRPSPTAPRKTELPAKDGNAVADAKSPLVIAAPTAGLAPTTGLAPTAGLVETERLDEQSQDQFLIQGLRLLATGNISSARLLFQRAADAGNGRAALLLGDTFDDFRLQQLGALGIVPDRQQAIYWYERADEMGAPEAKERLSEMNSR